MLGRFWKQKRLTAKGDYFEGLMLNASRGRFDRRRKKEKRIFKAERLLDRIIEVSHSQSKLLQWCF